MCDPNPFTVNVFSCVINWLFPLTPLAFHSSFLYSQCAGVFGAFTASLKIIFVQTVPAFVGIWLVQYGNKDSDGDSWDNPLYVVFYSLGGMALSAVLGIIIARRESGVNGGTGHAQRLE
jgi:hypothetical protein